MARLYIPEDNGSYKTIEGPLDIESLQELVGGFFEIVRLRQPFQGHTHMIVNDEGLLIGLPRNNIASNLYGDLIVGDVVLVEIKNIGQDNEEIL